MDKSCRAVSCLFSLDIYFSRSIPLLVIHFGIVIFAAVLFFLALDSFIISRWGGVPLFVEKWKEAHMTIIISI